jgi:hypothetical protein
LACATDHDILSAFLVDDMPASNALTRELVLWQPSGSGLISDLEQDYYYYYS